MELTYRNSLNQINEAIKKSNYHFEERKNSDGIKFYVLREPFNDGLRDSFRDCGVYYKKSDVAECANQILKYWIS